MKPLKILFSKYVICLILISTILIYGCTADIKEKPECLTDSDCVPATCCHASECVSKENAPDCTGLYCTQDCVPGTLDCQQGRCACIAGKCKAEFLQ